MPREFQGHCGARSVPGARAAAGGCSASSHVSPVSSALPVVSPSPGALGCAEGFAHAGSRHVSVWPGGRCPGAPGWPRADTNWQMGSGLLVCSQPLGAALSCLVML